MGDAHRRTAGQPLCRRRQNRPELLHAARRGDDEFLLQNAVTMGTAVTRQSGMITATVTITNSGAGHSIPTDSPLRQMILLVEAVDEEQQFQF